MLKNASILVIVSLYFLTLIQASLSIGLHKIAHAVTETNSQHSHAHSHESNAHGHHHAHDHEYISFFDTLFAKDAPDTKEQHQHIEYDKHIVQFDEYIPEFHKIKQSKNFRWEVNPYVVFISITSPPPQHKNS